MTYKPFTIFRVLCCCPYGGGDNNTDYKPEVVAQFANEDDAHDKAYSLQELEGWDYENYNNDYYMVEGAKVTARDFYEGLNFETILKTT